MCRGIWCRLCHQKGVWKPIQAFTIVRVAVLDGCHVLWICINPIMSYQNFFHWDWLVSHVLTMNYLRNYSFTITPVMQHKRQRKCICMVTEQHSSAFIRPACVQLYDWRVSLSHPLSSAVTSNHAVFTVNTPLWLHVASQMVHVNIPAALKMKHCK